MDIKLTGFNRADFPSAGYGQSATLVLVRGPDAYCNLRPASTVNLLFDDGSATVTVNSAAIGPLLNFFPSAMMAAPAHFAVKPGFDGRAMVDALEKMYPGDASAIDPRTIYSCLTVAIPAAVVLPAA